MLEIRSEITEKRNNNNRVGEINKRKGLVVDERETRGPDRFRVRSGGTKERRVESRDERTDTRSESGLHQRRRRGGGGRGTGGLNGSRRPPVPSSLQEVGVGQDGGGR